MIVNRLNAVAISVIGGSSTLTTVNDVIQEPSIWAVLPFASLLLAIAILPLAARHWWERWYPAVSTVAGCATIGYYAIALGQMMRVVHTAMEYAGFMTLIGSLYVVSGGIVLNIRGRLTPAKNVALLGAGALAANVLGTTGASMLLIRPFLKGNRARVEPYHIVFFIVLVSNVGGALTPIGDPPLFLGYLRGVPFFWVTAHLWKYWAITVPILLAAFFFIDRRRAGDKPKVVDEEGRGGIRGWHNLVYLIAIVGTVFVSEPEGLREVLFVVISIASFLTTRKEIYAENEFSWDPLKEVAILFLGIFATMIPALDLLERYAGSLGIVSASQFFWATGCLSSVLDNAPTYLSFLSAVMGLGHETMEALLRHRSLQMEAISIASVFFGAMTYIGNGPNFMVKSIAEHFGVRMPGFGAYVIRYAMPMLLPLLILIWIFFFAGLGT
jgi:Na+/H+ antiporter NhaD/arsenite permease-like protein